MKKILVTGATGFVGYHVAKKLTDRSWGRVVCLARRTSEKRHLKTLPVTIVEGDLLDVHSLEPAVEGSETIFHVAADYKLWSRDPESFIKRNVEATENILGLAKKYKVKKIVYTSSVSAVGRPEAEMSSNDLSNFKTMPRDVWEKKWAGSEESDPTAHQLIGPYKKSKFLAELAARRAAQEGLPVVIVNPSTPVGTHDVKPTPTGKLIVDFLNGRMPGYLDTGLNVVDVEDVAEGHLLAAEKGRIGERYILGNRNMMLREILAALARITGRPEPKFKVPYWLAYVSGFCSTSISSITGRDPSIPLDGVRMAREIMFYDCAKAARELGFQTNSVEKALEKAVRFYEENGYVNK